MNIIHLLFIVVLIIACNDVEFEHLQPANPPVGLTMTRVDGDYLLEFRSENQSNQRFGGFLIFIDANKNNLMEMYTQNEADYILGTLNEDGDSIDYNVGIDTPIIILFSDEEEPDYIEYTNNLSKDRIVAGSWLTLRTYLVDDYYGILLEVSSPGNPVYIEP